MVNSIDVIVNELELLIEEFQQLPFRPSKEKMEELISHMKDITKQLEEINTRR